MISSESRLSYLQSHSPRCLRSFLPKHIKTQKVTLSFYKNTFNILCKCQNDSFTIWGYSLKDYNIRYNGPILFISPLSACCTCCTSFEELLDTGIHGYHGEMNASSSYRGRGSPSMFKCSKCDGVHFQQVSPEFGYDDNSFALFEEPMAFAEYKTGVGIEDYFRDFSLTAICSKCHSSELISSIDL